MSAATPRSDWLDEIPTHWSIERVSNRVHISIGWTPSTADDSNFDGENLWANISDLGERHIRDTTKRVSGEAVRAARARPAPAGSLLFSFKLSVGTVSFAQVPMYTNEAIAAFTPRRELDMRYAFYAFPIYVLRNAGENIYGAPILNQTRLAQAKVAFPPLAEQRAIADYLDRETAQIDAFIAKNEELMTLLAERRAAVIDDLLESGSESTQAKLGWLFTFHNGDRGASYPSRDEFVAEGVPFVNAGHLENGGIDYNRMNYVSEEKFAEMDGAKLRVGDLLFCLRGSLGKLGVFDGRSSGALASSLVALRRRDSETSVQYVSHLLRSSRARDAIDLAQTGTAQPNLSVDQLAQFRFAIPDSASQHAIATRIEQASDVMNRTVEVARRAIELARERRAALISAAVTGKIDVTAHAEAAASDS